MTPLALADFLPALVLPAVLTPLARRLALAANLLAAAIASILLARHLPEPGA